MAYVIYCSCVWLLFWCSTDTAVHLLLFASYCYSLMRLQDNHFNVSFIHTSLSSWYDYRLQLTRSSNLWKTRSEYLKKIWFIFDIVCTVQPEALIVASKEIGLEVNTDKTKYMVTSRDQNAGRSQNMRTENRSFERVGEFKYLGTTLTNQSSIQEEIKSRLNSQNACYYSVQNFLSSGLLSRYLKINILAMNFLFQILAHLYLKCE